MLPHFDLFHLNSPHPKSLERVCTYPFMISAPGCLIFLLSTCMGHSSMISIFLQSLGYLQQLYIPITSMFPLLSCRALVLAHSNLFVPPVYVHSYRINSVKPVSSAHYELSHYLSFSKVIRTWKPSRGRTLVYVHIQKLGKEIPASTPRKEWMQTGYEILPSTYFF